MYGLASQRRRTAAVDSSSGQQQGQQQQRPTVVISSSSELVSQSVLRVMCLIWVLRYVPYNIYVHAVLR